VRRVDAGIRMRQQQNEEYLLALGHIQPGHQRAHGTLEVLHARPGGGGHCDAHFGAGAFWLGGEVRLGDVGGCLVEAKSGIEGEIGAVGGEEEGAWVAGGGVGDEEVEGTQREEEEEDCAEGFS
jgi:hypothetical protein